MNKIVWLIILCVTFAFSCENSLNIEPPSEFSSEFIQSENGINAVLNSAYNNIHYNDFSGAMKIYAEEATTDLLVNYRGWLARQTNQFETFTFNSQHSFFEGDMWNKPYSAIRDANEVLDNLDATEGMSQEVKDNVRGQAKFVRGLAYTILYDWFGPVPLVTEAYKSSNEDFTPAKASEEELFNFIETELIDAANLLTAEQAATGRATKGAALGVLTKFYLQTKQWSNAAETAQQVMDLNIYDLVPELSDLWALDNENNEEMIYSFPATIESKGNIMIRDLLPPNYPTDCQISATQIVMPVEFYNTYSPNDERNDMFITEYTTTGGEEINLLEGNEFQNPRVRKRPLDPECTNVYRADYPYVRYADILLSRAEALVMSSGSVSQEALGLLNQVHNRAGLSDISMSEVPNQTAFIDTLLWERAWEFVREGKRRQDLIRHDRFIENARDRGVSTAEEYHRRMPIPRAEVDANPNLEQNPGY